MKKLGLFILFVLLPIVAIAQITTNWPYLLPDFTAGKIQYKSGVESDATLNIHLRGNVLQMIAIDGKVMRVLDGMVYNVTIEDKEYVFAEHQMMQVVARRDSSLLLRLDYADWDQMFKYQTVYGMDLNTARSQDLRTLNLAGIQNEQYERIKSVKTDGREIPIKVRYYMLLNGELVLAKSSEVNDLLDKVQRKKLKSQIREQKLSWHEESDLIKIFDLVLTQVLQMRNLSY